MTLFTKITTTALATVTAFGCATAAFAVPGGQPYVAAETNLLLRTAKSLGIKFFTEKTAPGACHKGLMGQSNNANQVLICEKNHEGNLHEMADTLRHELVHSAQFCKGKKVGATSALLFPNLADKNLATARDVLGMPMGSYKPSSYYREAEARVVAWALDEKDIADLLIRYCS